MGDTDTPAPSMAGANISPPLKITTYKGVLAHVGMLRAQGCVTHLGSATQAFGELSGMISNTMFKILPVLHSMQRTLIMI